jgi:PPK2 family polyphosphate:nucleotide phosphotransferase
MAIDIAPFRAREGETIKLKHRPTHIEPLYDSKAHCDELLASDAGELDRLQQRLYAADSHAVLLIFQAMDAAGKDGAIRHVMGGINPQGCDVFSYKQPSAEELRHDFLWRCSRDLPARGTIGIFNRSYYEEVLIVRVHPAILHTEGVAESDTGKLWRHRYRSINGLERHLHDNRTRIVKFFLHLSKHEQRERFLARIEEAKKNWKFSVADIQERAFWDDYMTAYEECLSATSTDRAPWYIVPADDKQNARLIVSRVIVETLQGLKLRYPKSDKARREELDAIRATLLKEKD